MTGYLDENARIPSPPTASRRIEVDVGKIRGLNSYGVRTWLQWVKKIDPQTAIVLSNCPTYFVRNFNSVEGFFTTNMSVKSFCVPYVSSNDESRQDVLYVEGRDFTTDGKLSHPVVVDSVGQALEIDALSNYFRFLERD